MSAQPEQVAELFRRISRIEREQAAQQVRQQHTDREIARLCDQLEKLNEILQPLTQQAASWKGSLIILGALAALLLSTITAFLGQLFGRLLR